MELDRRELDKILAMDDESFKSLARTIASAAGANQLKTEIMLSNPQQLKSRISGISEKDAQQLVDSVGEEKSREILQMLRMRGIDLGK